MPMLLYYQRRINAMGTRLARIIRAAAAEMAIESRSSVDGVQQALASPLAHSTYPMVVLMIHREDELDGFIENRSWLDGHRVILVLPDSRPSIIAKAHQLFPRFITYLDRDWSEIAAIVEKWRQSRRPRPQGITVPPAVLDGDRTLT